MNAKSFLTAVILLVGTRGGIAAPDLARTVRFDIAPQQLSAALLKYSEQSGIQVTSPSKLIYGRSSAGVVGSLPARSALERILQGTELGYEVINRNTVAIVSEADAAVSTPGARTKGADVGLRKDEARVAQGDAGNAAAGSEQGSQQQQQDTLNAAESTKLDEIVVTAQKRSERLQDVPIAITSVGSAELQAKGITDLVGVLEDSPSVTVERGGHFNTNDVTVYMRAQGPGAAGEGSVGFYQDGFFISSHNGLNVDLGDAERVEVLRGPQGTLYGKNTTGGAINFITKKPTGEFDVKQTLDLGARNLLRSLTVVDLPSWHDLSAKVSLLYSSIDGFVKNPGASHDFDEHRQKAARLQLRWRPVDALTTEYFVDVGRASYTPIYQQYSPLTGTPIPLDYTGTRQVIYYASTGPMDTSYRAFDIALNHDDVVNHGLTLAWDLNEALTIKSLTGYRVLRINQRTDLNDIAAAPFLFGQNNRSADFSQELQFLGRLGANIRYVAGLYYFDERGDGSGFFDLRALSSPTLYGPGFGFLEQASGPSRSKSKAVFGQATWTPPILARRLELTVGARYTADYRAGSISDVYYLDSLAAPGVFDQPYVAADQSLANHYHSSDPAFIASFRWTNELMSYAKVSSGYKSGGIFFTQPGFNPSFEPEKITTFELGLKSEWLDHRLRVNGDTFYSQYRNLQQIIQAFGTYIASFNPAAINVGRATISGAELEIQSRPVDALSLSVNYAFLNPKFIDFPTPAHTLFDHASNPASPFHAGENIAGYFTLPFASKHSVALYGDYTFLRMAAGSLTAHMDYRWQSGYYRSANVGPLVQNRQLAETDAFGLINARLTWGGPLPHDRRFSLGLWGRNLANYRRLVGDRAFAGSQVPPVVTAGGTYGWWMEPRSYGVSLVYEY